ncbi:MAG: MBL fold metallo-hydrolase [Elusimicrobiota bacterium]
MHIETIVVGILETNCYVCVMDNKEALIVDPGAEGDRIINYCRNNKLKVRYIFNTHGHGDHIGANKPVKDETRAPICIHSLDKELLVSASKNLSEISGYSITSPKADILLEDNQTYIIGNKTLRVLHTPGHTHGCVCLIIDNALFSGDTLFRLCIGRTDLPHSSDSEMRSSLSRLKQLDGKPDVYPGHGEITTLEYEFKNNPYLLI